MWRHALAARRSLFDEDPEDALTEVAAAREALDKCPPDAATALAMAYLAHVEVTADHVDAAMLLAVDASLLTEQLAVADQPSKELHQAHRWLSLTLSSLDLEELAVEQALRGCTVAAALPPLEDQWRMLLLCAHQHTELAQTLHRRGESSRAQALATIALGCAKGARELGWEPDPRAQDLLDVVQSWALTCSDQLDDAVGPLRRVHRRVHEDGGLWLRGFTDLALGRLLARLGERGPRPGVHGEEAVQLLVDAAGAFVAAGDRRRYRQCLLELGRLTADLGRPAEALHWLEAYRSDTGRAHARGRQLWAEMFVRRSRLREAERQAALLRRHALEDPLTGLGNRRSAERRLGALRLGEEPLSLAVVDVDRFKSVNDEGLAQPRRRRPAQGRGPAARAQPHRRRGVPLGRRRVPRRAAHRHRGAGRRGHGAAAGGRRRRRLARPARVRAGDGQHRRRQRPGDRRGGRPGRSAGARCSTPPTCTSSRPSAAAATGCAPRAVRRRRRRREPDPVELGQVGRNGPYAAWPGRRP